MLIFQILTITVFQVKNSSTISLLCCYCFFNAKNLRVGRTTLNREKKRMAWDVFTGTWYSLIFTCIISGYRLHKFELFLVGFLIAFSFSYIMCTENLSDELSGTVLEYKDQVKNFKILMNVELPAYLPMGKDNRQNNFLFVPVMSEGCMSWGMWGIFSKSLLTRTSKGKRETIQVI